MLKDVVVLGSGSAGLLAALTLKRKIPALKVRIVRDPAMGIIGVGEGTTPSVMRHLLDFLRIDPNRFYSMAKPTWKLGIQFKWGPRGQFNYTFDGGFDQRFAELSLPNGYYCIDNADGNSICSALMSAGKVFPCQADGSPFMQGVNGTFAFHVENHNLVTTLETECREAGVLFTDGKMTHADQDNTGINAIHLEDGQRIEADFYIDASGFRGELISGVLEESFVSFKDTLFCDRAVVGGWERTDEPIHPFTTAEQMDAGWAWQIEHENFINRGYVFSSEMKSDEEAFKEFRRKNPKVPETPRFVPFVSGHRKRFWIKNVVAIGNSAGFVEPMEASALMVICNQCEALSLMLLESAREVTQTIRDIYNDLQTTEWSIIRDFLGLHYKYNTALDTPFWKRCRAETDLSGIQDVIEFYHDNGPSQYIRQLLPVYNDFGVDGFLAMMIFNQVPCKKRIEISQEERQLWDQQRAYYKRQADSGLDVKQMLAYTRLPNWQWN